MKRITLIIFLFVFFSSIKADYLFIPNEENDSLLVYDFELPDNDQFLIGVNYTQGNMIPHAKEVLNVTDKHPRAIELLFLWHLNNKKVWDDCNSYPRMGVYIGYYDYQYEEILGHGYSGGINFEYFLGLPTNYNFYLQGKAGLTYLTKPHDEFRNPNNMSYSTHLNYLLSVGAGLNVRVLHPISFKIDYSMNHNSNAALTEPNGGINYTAWSVAALYALNESDFKPRFHTDPYLTSEKKKRWDIALSYGISAMPYPQKGQVPMYGVAITRSLQIFRFTAVNFGCELEHNGRAVEITRRMNPDLYVNPYRFSTLGGVDFLMGRAILSMQVGAYLSRPFKEKDDLYQRWGLMYNVVGNISAGINFKSYRNYADHLSLRMTYSF